MQMFLQHCKNVNQLQVYFMYVNSTTVVHMHKGGIPHYSKYYFGTKTSKTTDILYCKTLFT